MDIRRQVYFFRRGQDYIRRSQCFIRRYHRFIRQTGMNQISYTIDSLHKK